MNAPSPAGPPANVVFAAVGERLLEEHPTDERGKMLQSLGLKTGGKFYAFATPADIVVKLPAARVAELIERGRGSPCETRPGRPMREWVRIPAPDEASCRSYVL